MIDSVSLVTLILLYFVTLVTCSIQVHAREDIETGWHGCKGQDCVEAPFTFHTIGDSHAAFQVIDPSIFEQISIIKFNTQRHWLKGKLMSTIGKDSDLLWISWDTPNDIMMVVCGEVDIRGHAHRFVRNMGLEAYSVDLVGRYERSLRVVREKNPNVAIWVYSIVPPTKYTIVESYRPEGSIEERVLYTQTVNQKLIEMCQRNGFVYIDTYTDYALQDGTLDMSLSDQQVHIRKFSENTKRFVAEQITKHFDQIVKH